jgi:hypothetical protein
MLTEEEVNKIKQELASLRKRRLKLKTAFALRTIGHLIWFPLLEIGLAFLNLYSAGSSLRANRPMWIVYMSLFVFDLCLSVGLMMLKDIYDMLWEIAKL